jgi:hypothetical protein
MLTANSCTTASDKAFIERGIGLNIHMQLFKLEQKQL